MKEDSIQTIVFECLKKHGPLLNTEIADLTGRTVKQVNVGVFRLKEKAKIGKVGSHWKIGSLHDPKRIQTEILNMIADGIYTPQEIADELGVTASAVSCEVSRLRRMGVKVKRVYVFED